jgi:hypothetical protein
MTGEQERSFCLLQKSGNAYLYFAPFAWKCTIRHPCMWGTALSTNGCCCCERYSTFWQPKFSKVVDCKPNRGHAAIAEIVQGSTHINVCTQNIDKLHSKSGVPSNRLIEVHGRSGLYKCVGAKDTNENELKHGNGCMYRRWASYNFVMFGFVTAV